MAKLSCHCFLALFAYASAAWSSGHLGADRPGGQLIGTLSRPEADNCFNECMRTPKCNAWVHKACRSGDGQCFLKSSVPPVVMQDGSDGCVVASGVRSAAEQGLVPPKFRPLRLGQVQVAGWMKEQLVVMANGLSGHLDLFWDDVMNSVWVGGTADHSGAGHERGPYWLNGMVPLVAHLNATGSTHELTVDINSQVNRWITYILDHQLPSGWLGPDDGFGGKGNTYWTGWNIAASLLQYADAVGIETALGQRCVKSVLDYIAEVHRRMIQQPSTAWSQNRWQDWVYIIHWLMDIAPQGQEQMLWDAAAQTQQQSWDWDSYYAQTGVGASGAYIGKSIPKFPEQNVGHWTMYDHGVNNAMATKSCHTWYRQSHNASDLENAQNKVKMQDTFHGQPHGMFAADECFGGRDLNRGIELCAVVEQMYSLQYMFKVDGNGSWMDRMERIAYNALPGTVTPDSWKHQYLQQANEINASYHTTPHCWQTDGDASTGFGVDPNFGCCTANMQQGWPKLVSNIFLEGQDGSLVVALLLPAKVHFGGAFVDMSNSDYPFADEVTIEITGGLKLFIRVPSWADQATLSINGKAPIRLAAGSLHPVTCSASTQLQISLNPTIKLSKGWGVLGKAAVSYDPRGARLPTHSPNDFHFSSGASTTNSKLPAVTDIRSGSPGDSSTAAVSHLINSEGHFISAVNFSFQYVSGYGAAGAPGASTVSVVFIDGETGTDIASIYESAPLGDYPFDHYSGYSPAVARSFTGLKIDCPHSIQAILRFKNNKRNLQIPLSTLDISIEWSAELAPGPHSPPSDGSTNAVAVYRGALLYALPLAKETDVVKTWQPFNNTDVNYYTDTPWSFALQLDTLAFERRKVPTDTLPWTPAGVRSTIKATACPISGWGQQCNAAAEPPKSPVKCGGSSTLEFIPYGATNLRMSALPWTDANKAMIYL